MGESFQDYSWIHDFEADFPSSFFDLFLVYLKTIDHLNLKLWIFVGILQVLGFDFKKFRILEILNFHPCDQWWRSWGGVCVVSA